MKGWSSSRAPDTSCYCLITHCTVRYCTHLVYIFFLLFSAAMCEVHAAQLAFAGSLAWGHLALRAHAHWPVGTWPEGTWEQ